MDLPVPQSQNSRKNNQESSFDVVECSASGFVTRVDDVATEEPMEIRVVFGPLGNRTMRSVSITMRTPGDDSELAVGFLVTEGLLADPAQVKLIESRGVDQEGKESGNIVRIELNEDVLFDPTRLQRSFLTTSSCGVCGKASLEALEVKGLRPLSDNGFCMNPATIRGLPDLLRTRQATFARTGGLHGTGLVTSSGILECTREDVGRHNAVDKLAGRYFLEGKTPLSKYAMIVSGRASFEIMQKGLVAGIPMVIAVGAPSSLAVETARAYNMTLIGFASSSRFNIYSAAQRVTKP